MLAAAFSPIPAFGRVAYLESTGTQYINTGFIPTSANIKLVADMQFTALLGDEQCGCYDGSVQAKRFQWGVLDSSYFRFGLGSGSAYSLTSADLNRHTFTLGPSGAVSVDETSYSFGASGTPGLSKPIFLFARNDSGTPQAYCKMRLYECTIYDGDTVIHHYIPYVKNGVGVLYDKATGEFLENNGSGSFVVGTVLNNYIPFVDDAVEAICATNWGDGVGITPAQAAAVTNIGWTFKDNGQITSFDEFRYFTGVTSVGNDAIQNCPNLASIIFPENLVTLGWAAFRGSGIAFADIPSTIITISEDCFYGSASNAVFICRATTPPSTGYMPFGNTQQKKIYVPYSADHSILAAYQASGIGSMYPNNLYELDQNGNIPS